MKRLNVAPIVEGHGEQASVRILITRVWTELLGGEYVEVLSPIRMPRSKLVRPDELRRAIGIAQAKLAHVRNDEHGMILVLFDADDDRPCVLAPRLQLEIGDRSDVDVALVIANVEYETWFVSAAESLESYLGAGVIPPGDPEGVRAGKGWIQAHVRARKYAEPIEQPRMTAAMDLALCRARSGSFDKLCREFEKRLNQ